MTTAEEQEVEMTELEVKVEEKVEEKYNDKDMMNKIHHHKSILDTTMSHGERVDLWDMMKWQYFLQTAIAGTLACGTFVIQWIIWKFLKISQCEEDLIYFSMNAVSTALFEAFQNGFCWIFGFIYLITATIIDYDAVEEAGYYNISIRKIRIQLLILTTFIAFILALFVSFIDPALYYVRFPTFIGSMVILYFIFICVFRKYIIKQAVFLLFPALIYIISIAIIFAFGFFMVLFLRESDYAFAAVYPIYIAIAQTVAITVMKCYHYLLCCCKKKYAVSNTYDPNSIYQIKEITLRYVCEEDGNLDTARRVSIMTNNNNEQIQMIEAETDKDADGRGVEYLWTDEWIYFVCGLFITFIESMRISGILVLRDNPGQIAISCVENIIMEILQRNNLFWEVLYRCCLKKRNPDRCKFDAIYYGARLQWEYMPISLLLIMNLLHYGPTNPKEDCYRNKLEDTYALLWEYWWLFLVIWSMEVMSDLLSELINWMLRWLQWIPIHKNIDGARKIIIVRVGIFGMTAFLITAIAVSEQGYEMDLSITNLLSGKNNVIDDMYKRFFH